MMRLSRAFAAPLLALFALGCSDIFGLDAATLDPGGGGGSPASSSTSTTNAGGAAASTTGAAEVTGAGGGGGDGGSGEGGEGAGSTVCDDAPAPVALATTTFDSALGTWTTPGFETTCDEGLCTAIATGAPAALRADLDGEAAQTSCLRFVLGAEGDLNFQAAPFVIDAAGAGFAAPVMSFTSNAPAELSSTCRLPATFDLDRGELELSPTPGVPFPEGATLQLDSAAIELLEVCPLDAPRCAPLDVCPLPWDAEVSDEDFVETTDFSDGVHAGWSVANGAWGEPCSAAGCTVEPAADTVRLSHSVGLRALPGGSCITFELDAVGENVQAFPRLGNSLGTHLNGPTIALGEDSSWTCSVAGDVTIDSVGFSLLQTAEGSPVTVHSARVAQIGPCCAPPCVGSQSTPCSPPGSFDLAGDDPIGWAPPGGGAFVAGVAGFGNCNATRIAPSALGLSMDGPAGPVAAEACLTPAIIARGDSRLEVQIEEFDGGDKVVFAFTVSDDGWQKYALPKCKLPAGFSPDNLLMVTPPDADSCDFVDVDRIDLESVGVNCDGAADCVVVPG